MKSLDWEIMNNRGLKEIIHRGFILYGASKTGDRTISYLKELRLLHKVVSVIDSDEKKWGIIWNNFKIYSPDKLNEIPDDIPIVITSVYLKEISDHLSGLGYDRNVIGIQSFRIAIHYSIMNGFANEYLERDIIERYKSQYSIWRNLVETEERDISKGMCFSETGKIIMKYSESILIHTIPKTGRMTLVKSFLSVPNAISTSHRVYYNESSFKQLQDILEKFKEHKIKIITGIREPIECGISAVWQNMHLPYWNNDTCFESEIDETWDPALETWLEQQLLRPFGIDVFVKSFDTEKGFFIIEKGNISCFIYRLDFLSSLEKELGIFSGVKNFKIISDNIASNKPYALAYRSFLEEVKIDKLYLEKVMNSRIMQHFYTAEERKRYREKWEHKILKS